MKKRLWMVLGSLTLACLTACGQTKTPAESKWDAAKKADDTAAYVTEHREELDVLRAEAESAETLGQQFKAVALLCMAEYQDNLSSGDDSNLTGWVNHDVFQFDYPNTSAYADQYFASINKDETAFWESLKDAYYPYDYFLPMIAATENLDGEIVSKLLNGTALEGTCKTKLEEAIEAWVENRPGQIVASGDQLMEMGYFDDWNSGEWTGTYLSNSTDLYRIRTKTAEDGLAYIRYIRDVMLPGMEGKISRDSYCKTSEITGEEYYSTDLAVSIGEELQLADPTGENLPETIDLEGKKVAAFYHNPTAGEDVDAPPSWRILGDFMMGLPEEELPATLAEADYYLVLTADHRFGNYYQSQSGKPLDIQAVYSSTSLDLYDAATGAFLRHIGKVMENPSNTIVRNMDRDGSQYPELTNADVLSYIYHNINDPNSYQVLLDHTSGSEPLQAGGTGLLGPWEITMKSYEVVKSFDDNFYTYSASDGCQIVRGYFTVTNRGFQKDSFLAGDLHLTSDYAMFACVMDESEENYYPATDAMTYSECLNGKSLEVGETKEGEVLFEVPDEALSGGSPLYLTFNLGNQMLKFSINE